MLPAIAIAVGALALAAIELEKHPSVTTTPGPTTAVGDKSVDVVATEGGTQVVSPDGGGHSGAPMGGVTPPPMAGEKIPPPAPGAPTFRDSVRVAMISTAGLTPREASDAIQQANGGSTSGGGFGAGGHGGLLY